MKSELAIFGGQKAITEPEELKEASRWPVFTDEDKRAVGEVLDSGMAVYDIIPKFEEDLKKYFKVKFALAHNNGTSAIQTAYFAVGVEPGDEVITSSNTWHLQVSQILTLHAIPVFCDIETKTGTIDPDDIKRKISKRTKAIAVVHPFGALAQMDEIMAIGRKYGIPIIEDCSHAHGATYKNKKAGTIGDIGCFSLQASKLMTGIEAGFLITNNKEYYERSCILGHYERIPKLTIKKYSKYFDPQKEEAPACFGFKYRIHPLAAAIARNQLMHLDGWNKIRRENARYLTEQISKINKDILEPPYEAPQTERTWINYICQYFPDKTNVPREKVIEALCKEGLPATGGRTGYLPVYLNPLYQERNMWAKGLPFDSPYVSHKIVYKKGMCPEAEKFWRRCIGLPVLHWKCSQKLLDEIVDAVAKVIHNITDLS